MKGVTTHTSKKNRSKSKVSAHNLGQIEGKQAGATEACSQHVAGSDSVADPQDGLKCEHLLKGMLITLLLALIPLAAEGQWQFCRLKHRGPGWNADYPRAGRKLIAMLGDVTLIDLAPEPLLVSATGEDLSQCAFVFASNVDYLAWTKDEAKAMGDWLQKGGFLWTDGFWGNKEWDRWSRQLRKALPEAQIWELHNHPIFEYPFQIQLQQPCDYWDGWVKHFAVEDDQDRLMVLMTFNATRNCPGAVGDSWESFWGSWQDREATWRFSVNVLLYVMTH